MKEKIDGKFNCLGKKRVVRIYQIVYDVRCGGYTVMKVLIQNKDVWRAAINPVKSLMTVKKKKQFSFLFVVVA